MKNIILAKLEDEAVMIDLDELVYLNYDDGTLYIQFKNGKDTIEVSCSDELASQLLDLIKMRVG